MPSYLLKNYEVMSRIVIQLWITECQSVQQSLVVGIVLLNIFTHNLFQIQY